MTELKVRKVVLRKGYFSLGYQQIRKETCEGKQRKTTTQFRRQKTLRIATAALRERRLLKRKTMVVPSSKIRAER